MEMKFEVNTQEIVDRVLERIKDEFIPKSVIEDIKADLISEYNNNADNWNYCAGIHKAIELIDNRISGKEKYGDQG